LRLPGLRCRCHGLPRSRTHLRLRVYLLYLPTVTFAFLDYVTRCDLLTTVCCLRCLPLFVPRLHHYLPRLRSSVGLRCCCVTLPRFWFLHFGFAAAVAAFGYRTRCTRFLDYLLPFLRYTPVPGYVALHCVAFMVRWLRVLRCWFHTRLPRTFTPRIHTPRLLVTLRCVTALPLTSRRGFARTRHLRTRLRLVTRALHTVPVRFYIYLRFFLRLRWITVIFVCHGSGCGSAVYGSTRHTYVATVATVTVYTDARSFLRGLLLRFTATTVTGYTVWCALQAVSVWVDTAFTHAHALRFTHTGLPGSRDLPGSHLLHARFTTVITLDYHAHTHVGLPRCLRFVVGLHAHHVLLHSGSVLAFGSQRVPAHTFTRCALVTHIARFYRFRCYNLTPQRSTVATVTLRWL